MPAIGANFSAKNSRRLSNDLTLILGMKTFGLTHRHSSKDAGTTFPRQIALLQKNGGAPATNTAADAPTGVGDLCLVFTGSPSVVTALYRCTAYTSTTVFTWAQVV